MTTFCLHLNKRTEEKLFAGATYYQPAEYISREICPTCGEISATDSSLETDIVAFLANLEDVFIADIDHKDCPDFCDAYLYGAMNNGQSLSENELEFINENCGDWINKTANLHFNGG